MEETTAAGTLTTVFFSLLSLCELLDEEAEEVENRQDPDYVPDFLGPSFNCDHWRTVQDDLATTADGLQAHPWLREWAHPVLERAVTCAERRCREQRSIINTTTLHKAAVHLQQAEERRHLASIWQAWRHRYDWNDSKSPDCAAYDLSARRQLPDSNTTRVCVNPWEVIVRLPPFEDDEDGLTLVEPLSLWETTAIAAYTTSADWTGGIVTLAAPPVIAQELLNPVRALDILHHTPGPSRTSPPSCAPSRDRPARKRPPNPGLRRH